MNHSQKIVEARALLKNNICQLERRLSKLLTPNELGELKSGLDLLNNAYKILDLALLKTSPVFKERLIKYLNIKN